MRLTPILSRFRSCGTLFSVVVVSFLAGCSGPDGSTSSTADSPDTEIRVGAKKSVSGLRFGKYKNDSAEDGEFKTLTLEARTSRTSRDYDGIWKGTVKKGSGSQSVSGGFTVVRRKIPMDSNVNGYIWTYVVKLFSKENDNKLFHESAFTNVSNSVALYDWKTKTEQIIDLIADPAGNRPFDLSCTLKELHDDNVFEEGLSMDEYPDIGIEEVDGKLEVNIGASYFDGTDNDKIVENSRSGSDIDVTILMDNKPYYHVKVTAKKGIIESLDGGVSKVADFNCR
jgi:hypothetical protein